MTTKASTNKTFLTPNEIAEQRGISPDKVIAWIRSGELRAVNLARKANGERPRFHVSLEALEEFDRRRAVVPPPPPSPRRRRVASAVHEYV